MTTHDTDPVNERRADTSAGDRTDFDRTEGDRADLDRADVDRTDADSDDTTRADDTTQGGRVAGMDRGQDLSADGPLVPQDEAVDFTARWEVVQQGFVDDPRNAVTEADKLVDDVLKRLAASFDQQHQELEKQWSDGEPSTEDLRSALQKYRAFFQRLLAL